MKRFNKILCVVDPDETMDTAVLQAMRIAEDNQAELTFISVLKPVKSWRTVFRDKDEYANELRTIERNKQLAIEHQLLSIAPSLRARIVVVSGIDFIEIIKYAIHHQHDLVVKCAEDIDWMERILGSEDMHLIRKCPCPVLMLKPGHKSSFRKILATVDVSELDEEHVQEQLNEQVLEYSAAMSLAELSEMHIGSVWEAYAEDWLRYGVFTQQPVDKVDQYVEKEHANCSARLEILVNKMDEMLDKSTVQYLQPKSHLVKGNAVKEIPLMVENYGIDLIVMGTVGRVGIPGLIIGNTAESILEQTKCSVLAIKPEGFKTPIE